MYEFKRVTRTDQRFSQIGRRITDFKADSNQGPIDFRELKGKWVVLLSRPADFSPLWTYEIERIAQAELLLKEHNCELVGIAVENDHSPLMWPKAVQDQFEEKIWFPVVFDPHLEIAKKLGMINQENEAAGLAHSIYIIDEHQILRSIIYYDPAVPDTMVEVIRLVKFLQKTNACGIVTPESWRPGDEWILSAPPGEKRNGKNREMWYF
jgi:peroxiredoxin (alkyl hydroperoxide reductase subunit C)